MRSGRADYLLWDIEQQQAGAVFGNGPVTDLSGINRDLLERFNVRWTPPSPISKGDPTWVGYLDCSVGDPRAAIEAAKLTLRPLLNVTITQLRLSVTHCGAGKHSNNRAFKIYPAYMPGMGPGSVLSYAEALRVDLNGINWPEFIFPPDHAQHKDGMRQGVQQLTERLAHPKGLATHVQQVELTPLFCCTD